MFARFAKTRAKAQALIIAGHPRIDGRPITFIHAELRVGNVLAIVIGGALRVIRIDAIPLRRGPPAEARLSYTVLSDPIPIDGANAGF